MAEFDKEYWEQRWHDGSHGDARSMAAKPPNRFLARELRELAPGTAIDAGCGAGAEVVWLASHGWDVTAAAISSEALASAAERAESCGVADRVRWVEADLSDWRPQERFDLVTTHYAHPSIPQLEFYARIAEWVAPGGTLLVVGHLRGAHHVAHAAATAADIGGVLPASAWEIVTAEESGHDVVVRALRLGE
jgi:2-polyprenyl-3-methyl-5-hydroxy-6-metoxy-1,4-benzoquinol methylase